MIDLLKKYPKIYSKLYKTINTPIQITFAKIYSKLIHKSYYNRLRNHDLTHHSYLPAQSDTHLSNFPLLEHIIVTPESTFRLIIDRQRILENRRVDLFDGFDIRVKYNDSPIDLFEYKFEDNPIHSYSLEDFIRHNVNTANQSRSLEIAQLITSDHEPINWQRDGISGYTWASPSWYRDIKYGHIRGAEIKSVWDLGRFHFLMSIPLFMNLKFNSPIKEKYSLSNLQKYFSNIILDFIATNPPRWGVQWSSAMDVGIRAVNFLLSYNLMTVQSVTFSDEFNQIFQTSILDHYYFIQNNLEWAGGQRGNHYYANICSLLIISIYLQKTPEVQHYITLLYNETLYQFNEEGSNFEASVSYHFFVTEMLSTTLYVLHQSNYKHLIPPQLLKLYSKIQKFSTACLKRNNLFPNFGDNDSGRFTPLSKHVNFAQILLPDEEFERPNISSYPQFGLFQYSNAHYEIFIAAGGIGLNGKGGHCHNHQLSFTLDVFNCEIIVDPGTYNYTALPDYRNLFRSTAYHNTLSIDNLEQNDFFVYQKDDLFWLEGDKAKAQCSVFNESMFIGSHIGYGSEHKRALMFKEFIISGKDYCDLEGKTNKIHFHLHPNIKIINIKPHSLILSFQIDKLEKQIQFECDSDDIFIEEYLYSPHYLSKNQSKKIICSSNNPEMNWVFQILE